MPWKRCDVCKENFDTKSDVCPHHTGHILTLISPQPVEEVPESSIVETPPSEGPSGEAVPGPETPVIEEKPFVGKWPEEGAQEEVKGGEGN